MTTMSNQREVRFMPRSELRLDDGSGRKEISGYTTLFNRVTTVAHSFREVIKPGCFARALREKQDVRELINHDPSKIIGRTKNNSLSLEEDGRGLRFRCVLPDTTDGRDAYTMVKDGLLDSCSFSFLAVRQRWLDPDDPGYNNPNYIFDGDEGDEDNSLQLRELADVDLLDSSLVCFPQYSGTSASVVDSRSLFPEGIPSVVISHQRVRVLTDDDRRRWADRVTEEIRAEMERGERVEDAAFERAIAELRAEADARFRIFDALEARATELGLGDPRRRRAVVVPKPYQPGNI
jgi:uncharacterized protein